MFSIQFFSYVVEIHISSNILLPLLDIISDRFLANVCMCSQAFKKAPDDPKPRFPTVSNLSVFLLNVVTVYFTCFHRPIGSKFHYIWY